MSNPKFDIDTCLLKARIAIQDGRTEEGIEELRRGIFSAAGDTNTSARSHIGKILDFAEGSDIYFEVEETLHEPNLHRQIFGDGD